MGSPTEAVANGDSKCSKVNGTGHIPADHLQQSVLPAKEKQESNSPLIDTGTLTLKAPEVKNVTWGNQIEFFLAGVSYSVGLGNIWRFPYLCMAYGGASFLIAYWTCLFLCAMPLYFMEICLGQFSGCGVITVWNICPLFKGLGYGMIVVSTLICVYFNNIIAWAVYFLYSSFTAVLPWSHCGNWWNTPLCFDTDMVYNSSTGSHGNDTASMIIFGSGVGGNATSLAEYTYNAQVYANVSGNDTIPWKSSAEEFWVHNVLQMSSGAENLGGIRWEIFAFMWIVWIITFLCFIKDFTSVGKVVYITSTAPYLLLTVLLIRAATLPGALDGIKFYLIPDLMKIVDVKVWAAACLQVFYSLGPGWGGILTMSSFNKFSHNCHRDGVMVPIVTGLTSFYGGIVVFCILGFMANQTGKDISSFIESGPGLVFIAYPRALAKLPIAPLWSVLFFLMVFTVGLGSTFALLGVASSALVSEFPKYLKQKHKLWLNLSLCVMCAVIGTLFCTRAGVYYFHVIDWYLAAFSVMLIGILEAIIVAWIYGHERFSLDVELMIGRKPNLYWKICWCFIIPFLLTLLFIYTCLSMQEPTYGSYEYPRWLIAMGWLVALASVIPIPAYMALALLREKGSLLERLKCLLKPTSRWGPADEEVNKTYKYTSSDCRSLKNFLPRRRNTHLVSDTTMENTV